MTSRLLATAAAAALCLGVALPATSASAAPLVKHYSSCSAVHHAYSGGIAKAGVKTNTVKKRSGKVEHRRLKGKVIHSTALYNANKRLDRDKDGIACEKS